MSAHDIHMRDALEDSKSPAIPLLNPIHPSIIDQLDPAFVKLYSDYIANRPPSSTDLNVVRQHYSALYSYATAPATGVGGIGETQVPGWDKYPGDVNVRVYVPPGEEPGQRKVWPVHFNFHGGGMSRLGVPPHTHTRTDMRRLGRWRPRNGRPYLSPYLCFRSLLRYRH